MTLKESYSVLGLKDGAELSAVKQSYRRLAFEMHPDLHPELENAAKKFQILNEAYVLVTQYLAVSQPTTKNNDTSESTEKARQEAQRAYKKAKAQEKNFERTVYKEEVLNDILKDPFAKRVFEDIYRHIKQGQDQKGGAGPSKGNADTLEAKSSGKRWKEKVAGSSHSAPRRQEQSSPSGMVGKIKGWFRRQIDDEQELRLPSAALKPGAVVRLEIQHGIVGKSHSVELVLPPGYKPGKSIRLKGLGKRVGNMAGDLYVRIVPI